VGEQLVGLRVEDHERVGGLAVAHRAGQVAGRLVVDGLGLGAAPAAARGEAGDGAEQQHEAEPAGRILRHHAPIFFHTSLNATRAREIRDFTVPIGRVRISAISSYDNPCTSLRTRISRSWASSRSRALFTFTLTSSCSRRTSGTDSVVSAFSCGTLRVVSCPPFQSSDLAGWRERRLNSSFARFDAIVYSHVENLAELL